MKRFILFLVLIVVTYLPQASAYEDYVYLGGESLGIVMNGNVEVKNTYEVRGQKPWRTTSIKKGSIILELNNKDITTKQDIKKVLDVTKENEIPIKYKNENKEYNSKIKPIKISSNYSLGLEVNDNSRGVGTLTYIDRKNNYAALGHMLKTNLTNGNVVESKIVNIKKSTPGSAGYKIANLSSTNIGTITRNNFTGIYGKLNTKNILTRQIKIKKANRDEIKLGNAKIFTVLKNNNVESFDIEIIQLEKQNKQDIKGIKIKITDSRLISQTGGIVQGMSGSPIIQNNKLIGAVTHVIVDNPSQGYGIYIDWMAA